MSLQTWSECLINSAVAGAAVANTTTQTTLLDATAIATLPANYLSIGKTLHIWASGACGCVVTASPTLQFFVRVGGSVNCFSGGAMPSNVVAKTNVPWILDLYLTCRAIGSGTAANFMGQGTFTSELVIGSPLPSAGGSGVQVLPYNAAPAVGTGFASTAAQTVDLQVAWGTANASNTITLHEFLLEAIN